MIGGRNDGRLNAAVAELAVLGDVAGYLVDVSEEASLRAFVASAGEVDHVASTVGGAMGGGFATVSIDEVRRALEQKFFDNLRLAQAIQGKIREGGSLTFTGGTGGRPHTASGAYLGNIGIVALAQSLASELAPRVRVNVVAPTWMDTPLWRDVPEADRDKTKAYFNQLIPLGRTAHIEEVASTFLFLMQNGFITGQEIAVDGGVMLRV